MSAPLLLLILGTVLAVAAFALRARGWIPWLIAAGGSLLLAAVALGIVLGEPFEVMGVGIRLEAGWTFLGRSLVLRPENRALRASCSSRARSCSCRVGHRMRRAAWPPSGC